MNDELRKLERQMGYLCTCFQGYVSALCPFHGIFVELPEVQIRRGGLEFPVDDDSVAPL